MIRLNTETYRSGHNGTDSKSVEPQGSVGSNPTRSAIKETSFVYQDKRGFFLAFWAKYRANNRNPGFGAVDWLLRSPVFCVQQQKNTEIAVVQIEFLCSASNY